MQKSNTQETFGRRWLTLFLVWLAVLFLEYLGVIQPVRALGERIVLPLEATASQITLTLVRPLVQIEKTYQQGVTIQALQQQLSQTQAQVAHLQGVEAENEALRQIFQNSDRTWQATLLTTPIISFGNPALAAGAEDGVHLGDAVLSYGTLVGRVGAVSAKQAEVGLLSSVSTPFLLAKTSSGVTGVVRGTGQQILFTEVSRNSQVENGELVTTVGQPGIPRDIPIGTIRTQVSTTADPVLIFQLNQPVTFYEASLVEVIPSGQ